MAKKQPALSKEMIENINEYSERISTLEDFVKAVRQMPGYHCGAIGNRGFLNLIREIAQNSIDQVTDPSSPATGVVMQYDERSLITTVEDNGLGIPFGDMIRIFTKENTSKNYKKKEFEYSSGLHGVGAKVTNALSDWFTVESYRYDGEARRLEMIDGYPKGEPVKIPNPDKKQGTKVMFHPHEGVLGKLTLKYEIVLNLIRIITSLTPIGTVVDFTGIDKNGKVHHEMIENKDGIITDLIMKTKKPLCAPVIYGEDNGTMKCEFAFVYDIEALNDDMNITAFSNFCPTEDGTHIKGFDDGVCRWFQSYMNKIFLGPKSKVQVKYDDIRSGMNVMLSTAHLYPIFDGQSKSKLSNEEMRPYVAEVVQRGLEAWSKSNPQDLLKVANYLKQVAQVRAKAEDGKAKLAKSYTKSAFSNLPEKYLAPTGTEDLELWLVEGDSAGGTAKSARVNAKQGVMPLRGKIPNAFEKSKADILSNAECVGMLDIIGGGTPGKNYGKYFQLELVKWSKIVGCPDADVDGSHINALLLRFFLIYARPILEAGMYYKAVSPLYGVDKGKKFLYFIDRMDMLKYYQKQYTSKNEIRLLDGSTISPAKFTAILLEFADYTWELNRLCGIFKLDPYMLEQVLMLRADNKGIKAITKEVKKNFKYIHHTSGEVDTIEGLVGRKYNTIFLTDMFIKEAEPVTNALKTQSPTMFMINGQLTSIYGLMNAFDDLMNSSVSRFKGLGELETDMFREAVMDPAYNRTLIQYTLDSAVEEIEAIRAYESDKSKILDHVESVSRLDLME